MPELHGHKEEKEDDGEDVQEWKDVDPVLFAAFAERVHGLPLPFQFLLGAFQEPLHASIDPGGQDVDPAVEPCGRCDGRDGGCQAEDRGAEGEGDALAELGGIREGRGGVEAREYADKPRDRAEEPQERGDGHNDVQEENTPLQPGNFQARKSFEAIGIRGVFLVKPDDPAPGSPWAPFYGREIACNKGFEQGVREYLPEEQGEEPLDEYGQCKDGTPQQWICKHPGGLEDFREGKFHAVAGCCRAAGEPRFLEGFGGNPGNQEA